MYYRVYWLISQIHIQVLCFPSFEFMELFHLYSIEGSLVHHLIAIQLVIMVVFYNNVIWHLIQSPRSSLNLRAIDNNCRSVSQMHQAICKSLGPWNSTSEGKEMNIWMKFALLPPISSIMTMSFWHLCHPWDWDQDTNRDYRRVNMPTDTHTVDAWWLWQTGHDSRGFEEGYRTE